MLGAKGLSHPTLPRATNDCGLSNSVRCELEAVINPVNPQELNRR
jgi:hypothetical protein